jgi:hypothetical protein
MSIRLLSRTPSSEKAGAPPPTADPGAIRICRALRHRRGTQGSFSVKPASVKEKNELATPFSTEPGDYASVNCSSEFLLSL